MPDRRGAAVIDDLPDDIIVGKILILLRPKDIAEHLPQESECTLLCMLQAMNSSTPEDIRKQQLTIPKL